MATIKKGIGVHQLAVLRILRAGDKKQAALVKALAGPAVAPAQAEAIVNNLMARGLVTLAYGRLRLTRSGRSALPSETPTWNRAEYVPEKVIRRAGSERAATLPSVAAGVRRYPGGAR